MKLRVSENRTDMPFVGAWEEVDYECRIAELIEKLIGDYIDINLMGMADVGFSKVVLETPFNSNWFCSNQKYWESDQDFEMRMRSSSTIALVFAGCHNLEIHAIPATRREAFYVSVPDWWGRLETSLHLIVPTTPVFAYYLQLAKASERGM